MRPPEGNFEHQIENKSREQHLTVIKFHLLLPPGFVETEEKPFVETEEKPEVNRNRGYDRTEQKQRKLELQIILQANNPNSKQTCSAIKTKSVNRTGALNY